MSDLDARCFIRKGNALVPADFAAEEFLGEIADGREVMVSVRKARSPAHHRWFFAMLRKVCENTDDFQTEDELLDALKLATGHKERRMKLDGTAYEAPRSINFASMPEDHFRRFKDRCLFVLGKVLGIDPLTLMGEVDATQKRAA